MPLDNEEIPLMMEVDATAPQGCPGQLVGFGFQTQDDRKESAKKGYPCHKDVVFVKIINPGDNKTVYCQPASQSHKDRFPRAWQAFQNRDKNPETGYAIEQWPQVPRSLAMTLRAMGIHTVEALSQVHDGNIGALGQQGRDLRAKAAAFLRVATDSAEAQKIAAEKETLQAGTGREGQDDCRTCYEDRGAREDPQGARSRNPE